MKNRLKQTSLFFFAIIATLLSTSIIANNSFDNQLVDAVEQKNIYKIKELLREGNDINSTGIFEITPLMRASYNGSDEIVRLLLKQGANANAKDIGGSTSLHLAARQDHSEIIKLLTNYGANINAGDYENITPLMVAAVNDNIKSVKTLIESGAKINKTDDSAQTALMHATNAGNKNIIQLLINSGADILLKDSDGMSALDIAANKYDQSIQKIFTDHLQNQTGESAIITPLSSEIYGNIDSEALSPQSDRAFLLQLGTYPSTDIARQKWSELKSKNSDLLEKLQLRISEVKLGNSGRKLFRTQAGYMIEEENAKDLCLQLRERKQECFVIETALLGNEKQVTFVDDPNYSKPIKVSTTAKPKTQQEKATKEATPKINPVANNNRYGYQQAQKDTSSEISEKSNNLKATPKNEDKNKVEQNKTSNQIKVVEKPKSLATISTSKIALKKPKPSSRYNLTKPKVEIAEAIRVPSRNLNKNRYQPQKKEIIYKRIDSQKQFWINAYPFNTENQAKSYWNNVRNNNVAVRNVKARPVKIYNKFARQKYDSNTYLQLGPISSMQDFQKICGIFAKDNVRCSIHRDEVNEHRYAKRNATRRHDSYLSNNRYGSQSERYLRRKQNYNKNTGQDKSPSKAEQLGQATYNNRANIGKSRYAARRDYSTTIRYWVDLGAFREKTYAQSKWKDLSQQFSSLLSNQNSRLVPYASRSMQTTLYRLQTGPFSNKYNAYNLCGQLRKNTVNCIAVKG